uniref:AraC family transcriptional regulator n=1 Tax=Roseihalotalea indica TaxID=2867963 RepID=A0AA49JGX5_9BACT|nr:AraC family transcriptional regulator [Tunicatimonas sp. TK19036]
MNAFNFLKTLRLSLLHIGFIQLDNQWQYSHVISPFSRLYLITDGEGWVFHHHQKFVLKPDYLYLIPNYTDSRYHCDQFLEQYYISFLHEMSEGMNMYDTHAFRYEMPAHPLDYKLFARLLELNPGRTIAEADPKTYDNQPNLLSFNLPEPNQSLGNFIESQGIMLQLLSRFVSDEQGVEEQKAKSYRRLASAIQHIHQHLQDKLTVEQLAASAYLHPDYFSRLFLEITGVRPIEYIQNKRLERAQLLLTTTNASLNEIADEVGIGNQSYFSRLFKRHYGMSPGYYRKTLWQV